MMPLMFTKLFRKGFLVNKSLRLFETKRKYMTSIEVTCGDITTFIS